MRRSVACELPERGWWFAPTIFTEVAPAHRIAVEEIFGPVVSVLTFRTQAEAIEKANNSAYGLAAGIWTDKGAKAFEVAERAAGRRGVAEHLQPLRPDRGLRRLQGERLRPRGRAGGAAAVPAGGRVTPARRCARPTSSTWAARSCARSPGAMTASRRPQRAARLAQGRARRGQGRARGSRAVGGAHRLQPRADPVPRGGGAGVARPASSVSSGPSSTRRSTCSCTTRAGPTSSQRGARGHQPGGRAVPVLLAARADRRGRPGRPRRTRAAGPGRRAGTGAGRRQRRGRPCCPRRGPLAALDLGRGAGGVRRARAAWSICCRGGARSWRWRWPAHRDVNAVVDASGDRGLSGGDRPAGRRERHAGKARSADSGYEAAMRGRARPRSRP